MEEVIFAPTQIRKLRREIALGGLTGRKRGRPMSFATATNIGAKRRRTIAAKRAAARKRRRRSRFRQNLRVGGFMGKEVKFIDNSVSPVTLQPNSDMTNGILDPAGQGCLNSMAEGSGEQERDGRKIVVTAVHVNGVINVGDGAGVSTIQDARTVFLALVLDKQTNASSFVDTELIYKNDSASSALVASPMRNLEYVSRFRVLAQTQIPINFSGVSIDATGSAHVPGVTVPFRFDISNLNIPVMFKDALGTVTSIVDNAIHLVGWTTNNVNQNTVLSYNSRVRFIG